MRVWQMRVVARRTLKEYGEREAEAAVPLSAWYREAKAAAWNSPEDVKEKYRSASILKSGRVVFNIASNKYRLVVRIDYECEIVFICFVGTHAEFDEIDAEAEEV